MIDVPKYAFGTSFEVSDDPADRNKLSSAQFKELLFEAIKLGVRHIDCAPLYETQKLVGQVLKQSTQTIPRREFFVTSKLPINMMRPENIERSVYRTLHELQLTHLDLLLIHAPFATKNVNDNVMFPVDSEGNLLIDDEEFLLENAWCKLIELKEASFVKYIGLSNVNRRQIDRCNMLHQVDVVQNEFHIYNQDRDLIEHCHDYNVHFEGYAAMGSPPLARLMSLPIFELDQTVLRIAKQNQLKPAQVVMQWLHQQPISYVVKVDNLSQLQDNVQATKKFVLSLSEMEQLDNLNKSMRLYFFDKYHGIANHPEYPFKDEFTEVEDEDEDDDDEDEGAAEPKLSPRSEARQQLAQLTERVQQRGMTGLDAFKLGIQTARYMAEIDKSAATSFAATGTAPSVRPDL